MFFNKGENCIAAGRLFVERKIHDEFMERIVGEVKKMKIGDPLDRSVSHGPQNHKYHCYYVIINVKVLLSLLCTGPILIACYSILKLVSNKELVLCMEEKDYHVLVYM